MKICANCGAQLPDDAAFCNNCGSALTDGNTGSASPETPAVPLNPVTPVADQAVQGDQQAVGQPNMQQNYQQYGQAPYQQPQYQQPYMAYDPNDHTSEFDPQDIAENRLFAVLPYLFSSLMGIIVGIYLKDSAFVKFHIRNSIRLDIAVILTLLLCIIPFLGWIAAAICGLVLSVVKIIAIVWVFQGKAKDLPIISAIGFLK